LHRRERNAGVRVVRRGDDDCVDIMLLFEHASIVSVAAGPWVTLERVASVISVDVTQSNDVMAFELGKIMGALPAHADAGDVQFVARRFRVGLTQDATGKDESRRNGCRRLDKASAREDA
jgi:hypothetical protein